MLKLDYLSQLGISLIWLMPIHPAKTYYKYDVEDFRCLIDECHQREILVLLDFVANHTNYDHPWFRQARSDCQNEYRKFYIWTDSQRVQQLSNVRK